MTDCATAEEVLAVLSLAHATSLHNLDCHFHEHWASSGPEDPVSASQQCPAGELALSVSRLIWMWVS